MRLQCLGTSARKGGVWPNVDKSGQRGGGFSESGRLQHVAVYGTW